MSEESLMPERDAIWAKHDGLTPALAAEMLAFAGKMEMERDVWKHESGKLSDELKKADEALEANITTFLDLGEERDRMKEALRKAILWAEGASIRIADREGINWTYLEEARRVLDSENAIGEARADSATSPHDQTL